MGFHSYGLCRAVFRKPGNELPMGSPMPDDQHGLPDTADDEGHSRRAVMEVPAGDCKATRPTELDPEQSRFQIHLKVVERLTLNTQCQVTNVDIFPSADGWPIRMRDKKCHANPKDDRTS